MTTRVTTKTGGTINHKQIITGAARKVVTTIITTETMTETVEAEVDTIGGTRAKVAAEEGDMAVREATGEVATKVMTTTEAEIGMAVQAGPNQAAIKTETASTKKAAVATATPRAAGVDRDSLLNKAPTNREVVGKPKISDLELQSALLDTLH